MKFPRSVTIAVLLGLISASLPAITLPVSEDSYATRTTGKNPRFVLAPNAGRASQLHVTKNHVALVRFNVGALGEGLPASEVDRALLMIHISSASRPESVWIHRVTADWTEASSAAGLAPSFDATYVAEIQADYLVSDQFVLIDVTDLVKDWLTDPASDFGVCLSTTGKCQVRVGSKERPASGYPAVLQIERVRVVGNAHLAPGIDATKLGTGSVDNTELGFLDGVTSVIQPRLDELGGDLDLVAAEVDGKVSKSGDIMSGALQLPADGLVVGGNQLTVAAGGVGIGTNTPGAKLDVSSLLKNRPIDSASGS